MANKARRNSGEAPQKTCRECGAKAHVRHKVCQACGQAFSPAKAHPLTTDESVDTVIMAMQLVKRLGVGETIKVIKRVAEHV